ncbi:MAG: hypothetical protein ACLRIP_09565 [Blautia massiliensis (ex Durand et al. 2017)]
MKLKYPHRYLSQGKIWDIYMDVYMVLKEFGEEYEWAVISNTDIDFVSDSFFKTSG